MASGYFKQENYPGFVVGIIIGSLLQVFLIYCLFHLNIINSIIGGISGGFVFLSFLNKNGELKVLRGFISLIIIYLGIPILQNIIKGIGVNFGALFAIAIFGLPLIIKDLMFYGIFGGIGVSIYSKIANKSKAQ